MKLIPLFLSLLLLAACGQKAEESFALFDIDAIQDVPSLDLKVIHDWQPAKGESGIRQKLVEIEVCEWWPGRTVRIPVLLNAPLKGPACESVLVINKSLALKTDVLRGEALSLLKDHGVGVVMVGMGTISEMAPANQLYLEMQRQLLDTKDERYSATWIWGMSQMRGLTAAMSEPEVFQPKKVLATGGSKRGIASAIAGIWDDRFTAIMPVVAPPLGNPGTSMVVGSDREVYEAANARFYRELEEGKLGLDTSAGDALRDRSARWAKERISLEEALESGWTKTEIDGLSDRIWGMCHVTKHLERVKEKGLVYFFNAGTNDSVTPSLPELGKLIPDFPINIVPGGQHGGPGTAGYTRRVTIQESVKSNLIAFARYHFFGDRDWVESPQISYSWDSESGALVVEALFLDGSDPEENTLWWNVNKSAMRTLYAEYDPFDSVAMEKVGPARYRAEVKIETEPETIDFMTVHTHTDNALPVQFSSAYQRIE